MTSIWLVATRSRQSWTTAGGACWSSALNGGRSAKCRKSTKSTCGGHATAKACKNRRLREPRRRLPAKPTILRGECVAIIMSPGWLVSSVRVKGLRCRYPTSTFATLELNARIRRHIFLIAITEEHIDIHLLDGGARQLHAEVIPFFKIHLEILDHTILILV